VSKYKKSTDTGLFCGVIPTDLAKNKELLKRVNEAFKPVPKREYVWVGVWHLEADDPIVYVSRTLHGLDLQIYEAIKDGFDEIFQDSPVPKGKSKAIGEYFQRCSDGGIAEWLLTTKEELK